MMIKKHFNNFMHKVVVPLQYVLAVASLIIMEVYHALDAIVKLIIGFVMEVSQIIDPMIRRIGNGIQKANKIMKEAMVKDYTKGE